MEQTYGKESEQSGNCYLDLAQAYFKSKSYIAAIESQQ